MILFVSARLDLNQEPSGYESEALTNWATCRKFDSNVSFSEVDAADITVVGVPGFEPGNKGFKGLCRTAWLYPRNYTDRVSTQKLTRYSATE